MSATAAQPWTIGRLLDWTREHLRSRQVADPRLSAELLLASALGCRKIDLYARFESVPAAEQVDRFRALVRRAAEHAPIAYLTGMREFHGLEFEVTPAVLIPRPETEVLVEQTVTFCRGREQRPYEILDLGTGSGCVAVAIARLLQAARVLATDSSGEALAVARRNVARHGLTERVTLLEADGPEGAPRPAGGFDVLVSNPPYIAEAEMASLPACVRDYEPRTALAGGADGLDLIRRIAARGRGLLAAEGRAFIEIAAGQEQRAAAVFAAEGWRHLGTMRDGAGIPRTLALEPPSAGPDGPPR